MLPSHQWVLSTSKCQAQSPALLLSLVYAEVKCSFLTRISLYSTSGCSIAPSLLLVAPSCEGCLGVWVFILWVISAVLKFTLRWADTDLRATPFACLTDAGISSVRHHAWHCYLFGPYFNCKWLYIFLLCMYPLVIKSWRKGLHGPPALLLYGAQCTASSPWLTVAAQPSCFKSSHGVSADLTLAFAWVQRATDREGKGRKWPLKSTPSASWEDGKRKTEWGKRAGGSAWGSLRTAYLNVGQYSQARKLHFHSNCFLGL